MDDNTPSRHNNTERPCFVQPDVLLQVVDPARQDVVLLLQPDALVALGLGDEQLALGDGHRALGGGGAVHRDLVGLADGAQLG